jgi:hypothetical protein
LVDARNGLGRELDEARRHAKESIEAKVEAIKP